MKRGVFYSWQADLPAANNRSFIEDALKRALKTLKKDDTVPLQPVLERDTSGLPGTPSIADSILEKITNSDVFVADISIINPGAEGRSTPNPNVLVELGFAAAKLGWSRVILVQNTSYGVPEELPFDLRGRRVVTYDSAKDAGSRSEVRGLLQGRLEAALRTALSDSVQAFTYSGMDVPLWWGIWEKVVGGSSQGGRLFIREVGPSGFLFDLDVYNGGHIGTISGFGRIVSGDRAYARFSVPNSDEVCEISFQRKLEAQTRSIELDETGSCWYFRGMGAPFSGLFTRRSESLFDGGILDELDLQRLYSISGSYFEALSVRFQGLTEEKNLDEMISRVTIGGVRGLYTIMEGILMRGQGGELWVAFIDDDVVRYFTTECEFKNNLPKTIENWRERFLEKKVEFHSCIDAIPKRLR